MDAKTEKAINEPLKSPRNGSENFPKDNKANHIRGRGFKVWGCRMGRGRLRREPGPMKGFAPPGFERAPIYDEPMNGFVPMRGMRRMRPYPDLRGHRRRDRRIHMVPPPPAPHPAPPMHHRVPFPPRHGAPQPPFFRGRAPHPWGRGMPPPGPPRHFDPRGSRGYHNGPVSPPPHRPLGRGQRWSGPPGGRRF